MYIVLKYLAVLFLKGNKHQKSQHYMKMENEKDALFVTLSKHLSY